MGSTHQCRKVILICSYLIVAVNIASTVVSLYFICYERNNTPKCHQELCMPCNELASLTKEEKLNMVEGPQGRCCVCDDSGRHPILLSLLQKYKSSAPVEPQPKKKNKGLTRYPYYSYSKPAAHLCGIDKADPRPGDRPMMPVRTWRRVGRSFVRSGMQYGHGRIAVPADGVYHIYSRVSFLDYRPADIKFNESVFRHSINKYNILVKNDTEILSTVRSKCESLNSVVGDFPSYLAGVTRLKAGDEVFVKVTDIAHINYNPSSHYFGIYLI